MWKITNISRAFVISSFLLLLSGCVSTCYGSQMYQISENELTTLETHLTELEKNNETLKQILSESNADLTIALDALTKSQSELMRLKAELIQCKNDAESAKASLKIANDELAKASESFKKYEAERDKVEGRLRNQRNIWEFIAAVAVGVAVAR